jgi:hypothetical protein
VSEEVSEEVSVSVSVSEEVSVPVLVSKAVSVSVLVSVLVSVALGLFRSVQGFTVIINGSYNVYRRPRTINFEGSLLAERPIQASYLKTTKVLPN